MAPTSISVHVTTRLSGSMIEVALRGDELGFLCSSACK